MAQVGIIMGSKSDLPIMKEAKLILDQFGISSEVEIVSAHRTPEKMVSYAKEAAGRGLKVIIAGAGGAARGLRAHRASPRPEPPAGAVAPRAAQRDDPGADGDGPAVWQPDHQRHRD